jgi:hypothetical protein
VFRVGQGLSDQRRATLLEKLRMAGLRDRKIRDAQGRMVVVSPGQVLPVVSGSRRMLCDILWKGSGVEDD